MQGHLHRLEADFAEFRSEVREDLAEIKKLLSKIILYCLQKNGFSYPKMDSFFLCALLV
jgi:hypothetical protein